MLQIFYNGKDISEAVSVNACTVELNLAPLTNNATVVFNDSDKTGWAVWAVTFGDVLSFVFDGVKLGDFTVETISTNRGTFSFELTASGVQRETTGSYVFKGETIKSAIEKICKTLDTKPRFFGDFSAAIDFLPLEKVRCFDALKNLGGLFGFCFVENAGVLSFVSFDYLKERTAEEVRLTAEDEYSFSFGRHLGKLTLNNGKETGEATDKEGTGEKAETFFGVLDLKKAAENELKNQNQARDVGFRSYTKHRETPLPFPGQSVKIQNAGVVFDGVFLVVQVRLNCGSRALSVGLRRL